MDRIKIYFAPMEGITTKTYRRVHRQFYPGVDRYYSPFIVVTSDHSFKRRDKRGILPYEEGLVPQLLTNDPEAFVWGAKKLADSGYEEVNLNAGCPVGTVVAKGKGAGLLENPDAFDAFLDSIFSNDDLPKISIKTRVGFYESSEAKRLAKILSRYPFCEVTVHPRAREDYYNGTPDMEAFDVMAEIIKVPICYNGDLCSVGDVNKLLSERNAIDRIMLGRGLIADPDLAGEIKTGERTDRLYEFLSCLRKEYKEELSGDRDVLFKLKEIWSYVGRGFPDHEKSLKTIRRCSNLTEYDIAVREILTPS